MDLNKRLDDLYQSFLTNQYTSSKHNSKRKKSSNYDDILGDKKKNQPKLKNATNKSSNSSNALANSKLIVKFSFDCPSCAKEYKTQKGLKNHKCSATIGANLARKGKTTRQKRPEPKQDDTKNQENIKPSTSNDNILAKITDKDYLELNGALVDEVPFQCNSCSEKFNHRRAFLHHIKNQQCKKTTNLSLQSLLFDIYEDTLHR